MKEAEGKSRPDEVYNGSFSGGREGLVELTPGDIIGSSASPLERTGLACLEPLSDVNLLAVPDTALFPRDRDRLAVHRLWPIMRRVWTADSPLWTCPAPWSRRMS